MLESLSICDWIDEASSWYFSRRVSSRCGSRKRTRHNCICCVSRSSMCTLLSAPWLLSQVDRAASCKVKDKFRGAWAAASVGACTGLADGVSKILGVASKPETGEAGGGLGAAFSGRLHEKSEGSFGAAAAAPELIAFTWSRRLSNSARNSCALARARSWSGVAHRSAAPLLEGVPSACLFGVQENKQFLGVPCRRWIGDRLRDPDRFHWNVEFVGASVWTRLRRFFRIIRGRVASSVCSLAMAEGSLCLCSGLAYGERLLDKGLLPMAPLAAVESSELDSPSESGELCLLDSFGPGLPVAACSDAGLQLMRRHAASLAHISRHAV